MSQPPPLFPPPHALGEARGAGEKERARAACSGVPASILCIPPPAAGSRGALPYIEMLVVRWRGPRIPCPCVARQQAGIPAALAVVVFRACCIEHWGGHVQDHWGVRRATGTQLAGEVSIRCSLSGKRSRDPDTTMMSSEKTGAREKDLSKACPFSWLFNRLPCYAGLALLLRNPRMATTARTPSEVGSGTTVNGLSTKTTLPVSESLSTTSNRST